MNRKDNRSNLSLRQYMFGQSTSQIRALRRIKKTKYGRRTSYFDVRGLMRLIIALLFLLTSTLACWTVTLQPYLNMHLFSGSSQASQLESNRARKNNSSNIWSMSNRAESISSIHIRPAGKQTPQEHVDKVSQVMERTPVIPRSFIQTKQTHIRFATSSNLNGHQSMVKDRREAFTSTSEKKTKAEVKVVWRRKQHPTIKSKKKPVKISTWSNQEYNAVMQYLRDGPSLSELGPENTYPVSLMETAPPVFLKYIEWHAKQMQCVRKWSCFAKEKSKIKLLVWRCPSNLQQCQGSGDRMRGIVTILALAALTKRVFLLMWPDNPFPFLHAVAPAAIDWRVPAHVIEETERGQWGVADDARYPKMTWLKCPMSYSCEDNFMNGSSKTTRVLLRKMRIGTKYFLQVLLRVGSFVIQSRGTYSSKLFSDIYWHRVFDDDRFRSPPTHSFVINRILLRTLFKPSPITQKFLHEFIPLQPRNVGYVSIHARTGHDVGETRINRFKWIKTLSDEEHAANFAACARAMIKSRYRYVFFASDSFRLKKAFVKVGRKQGLRVMYTNFKATHVGMRKASYAAHNVDHLLGSDIWKTFVNVFVEFFAVANGTIVISNRSEFSRMANMLSNSKASKTIRVLEDFVSCESSY